MAKKLLFIIPAISLFRLLLSRLFPITGDEAYYWLWSKHLALSFVDHPPLIAYLNYFFTGGSESLLMLRLEAILISMLVSFFLFLLTKNLFDERTAFWAVLLFQFIPHFFVFWLTMFVELPFALFWIASLYALDKILKDQKGWAWWWIFLGLGFLSKYTMLLFPLCLIIFLAANEKFRPLLFGKKLYLSFAASLIIFSPVLYWNSQNHWVSFGFHAGRLAGNSGSADFLAFFGEQLINFTPQLLLLLPFVLFYYLKQKNLLAFFSAPVLLLFFALAAMTKVWPHWPSAGYLAALPLLVNYLLNKNTFAWKKFFISVLAFDLLILIILFFFSPGIIARQKDYAGNYTLSARLPGNLKIYAFNHASAGILEFYLKRPVYLAPDFLRPGPVWGEKQFKIFGKPEINVGDTVLYFGPPMPAFDKSFLKTSVVEGADFYFFEDYLNRFKFYKLENYRDY